jgi:uncharacterized membrane protein YfcA
MPHLDLWQIVYFVLVVVLSFVIRGTTGFGGNVVSVPLIALILPVPMIVPAFAILGIVAGIGQAFVSWRDISWRIIRRDLPLAVLGVAVGIFFFKQLAQQHVFDRVFGGFIVVYALYTLMHLARRRASGVAAKAKGDLPPAVGRGAGFCAGFFSAIFGQGGNFYVIYLNKTALGKAELRATLSSILVLISLVRTAAYASTGFLTSGVLAVIAMGLPAMVIGMGIGQFVHVKLSREAITAIIMAILLVSGGALILR